MADHPTTTVVTSEIRPDDIVFAHGMRVRIDSSREIEDATSYGGRLHAHQGTVLNKDEAITKYDIPRSFLYNEIRHVHGPDAEGAREDTWTIQGNDLATWTIAREA